MPVSSRRKPTTTSPFGVGRRESHDASGFYARFTPPTLSDDDDVETSPIDGKIIAADARKMREIDSSSVALVVTSPPYFAGKEYEEALGEGHVPASYLEYLMMLRDVFAECVRTLEPGGRIAVNVANLGRKPYRSLSADVIGILQDDLGLLLRGEVIWLKARGASSSCAWGSYQSPANPVLRDVTERVIIASKGRFDRVTRAETKQNDRRSGISVTKDEFMEATTDVWEIPSESARQVGHPAPFPVELPLRLIELYTYRDDLVLDPFIGSGTTAIAADRVGRRYVGYDTDPEYVRLAEERIDKARAARLALGEANEVARNSRRTKSTTINTDDFQARARREGMRAREMAQELLGVCGFDEIIPNTRVAAGVEVNFSAVDKMGKPWFFDVSGAFTSTRAGLKRTDTLWKALGKAAVLHADYPEIPLVLLTTDAPLPKSAGDRAWRAISSPRENEKFGAVYDVIEMESPEGHDRLCRYASGLIEQVRMEEQALETNATSSSRRSAPRAR